MRGMHSLPAKLTRPATIGLVRRERLFKQLDESLRRKLVWVSGPGGAGKTSLLSTYLETRRLHPLWYQIDVRDTDLATFFHYLRLAAQGRGGGEPLQVFEPRHAAELEAYSRRFFEAFFARFQEQVILVFDGYQDVGADSRLHEAMLALLNELPSHARVVVISRGHTPPALARWVASPDFAAFDQEQLAFSLDESLALASTWGTCDQADVARLRDISRGWAAGMMLLLRAARGGVSLERSADSPPEMLFAYFANEVFARIPAAQRDFLQRTAFIPHITPALAQQLTGEPRAAKILAGLNRENFFTERKSHSEAIYEYHPLFREFLVDRAIESLGASEVAELRTKAASLLEADGQVDVAALLLIEAEDWERLKDLVRKYADDLMGRGRFQTLRGWIEAIPPAIANEAPWVLLWKGICQAGAHEAAYLESVRQACVLFDTARDFVGSFSARIWRIRLSRSLSEVDECMRELESLADRHYATASPEEEAQILGTFGRFRFDPRLSATHPLLARLIQRAAELARSHDEPSLRLRMVNFLTSAVSLTGDYVQLEGIVSEHCHLIDDPRTGAGERLNFMIVLALLRASQGAWDETRAIIARVRELVETTGFPAHEATLATAALRCDLSLGNMESARAARDRLTLLADSSAMARIHFLNSKIQVSVADAESETARDAMDELLQLVPPGACFRSRVESLNGLLLLERGDYSGAIEQLLIAKNRAEEGNQLLCTYPTLLLLGLAKWRSGSFAQALEYIAKGLASGRRSRMRVGMPAIPRRLLSEICDIALRNGVEPESVRDLIAALRLEPPPAVSDRWPWPVRVYVLGGFECEAPGGANESRKSKGRKQPKKPFELLRFLVAQGGGSVSIGYATDSLWPNAEGDAGKKAFEITLHRLRKLLGPDDAVRLEGGKLSLNGAICWIDSFAFERLAEQAEACESSAIANRPDEVATRALALYRGGFLADEDEHPWAAPYREKLRAKFLRLVGLAGERLESSNRADEAERWYRKALEIDVTAEPIYRRLMRSLAAQERSAEAIEIYRRCREMLSIVLAAKPSPETEAIYLRLRQPDGNQPRR